MYTRQLWILDCSEYFSQKCLLQITLAQKVSNQSWPVLKSILNFEHENIRCNLIEELIISGLERSKGEIFALSN